MVDWEERAIASVRAGAPDVEAVYMAYRVPMKQTAARKLEGEHNETLGLSADDVVAEIIADVYEGKIKLDPSVVGRLRPYLRRIVANQAVSLMRLRGAESRARSRQHPADLTDIEADVETIVLAEQVEDHMSVLTDHERHVMVEYVKKGRPAKDVAVELECTPQNISQLRKSALRKLFADLPFGDDPSNDQLMNGDAGEREEGAT